MKRPARAGSVGAWILLVVPGAGIADPAGDLEGWGLSLGPDPGTVAGIETFPDGDEELPAGYARDLAEVLHRLVLAEAAARIRSEPAGDPIIDVSFPRHGFAREGRPDDPEVVRDFEDGFVRTEVLARLPVSATPARALGVLSDPEFRRRTSARIDDIRSEHGLLCIDTRGTRPFVRAMRSCSRDSSWHADGISSLLSRTVATSDDGGRQPVYFKESLKTFVATPDGLLFHSIHYSRTRGFGTLTRRIARGKIEDAQRRTLEMLAAELADRGDPARY